MVRTLVVYMSMIRTLAIGQSWLGGWALANEYHLTWISAAVTVIGCWWWHRRLDVLSQEHIEEHGRE